MQFDQKQLFQLARDYPWYLFTGEEISELCNVGELQVRRVRNAPDSPFRYSKCRPEWFTAWMQSHPETEETQSLHVHEQAQACEKCEKAVQESLRLKPTRVKTPAKGRRRSKRLMATTALGD
jgi:hypothetical protein